MSVTGSRVRRILRLRSRRVDLLVALLLGSLGFALVVQVHSTQNDGVLASARQEDLVQILDELSNRSDRLRQEVATLNESKERLTAGSGATEAALAEARRRTQLLGVIAGTAPATGPGVQVRITDPRNDVSASVLLDVLEELRNAGAEAVQFEGTGVSGKVVAVRLVAQSAFEDRSTGITVEGQHLVAPFRFTALGDASTLAGAMAIPGGVEDSVQQQGGTTQVTRSGRLRVGALRPLSKPRYARPD
jgi:uncharacterized protein YlxW (UPF0749 family)